MRPLFYCAKFVFWNFDLQTRFLVLSNINMSIPTHVWEQSTSFLTSLIFINTNSWPSNVWTSLSSRVSRVKTNQDIPSFSAVLKPRTATVRTCKDKTSLRTGRFLYKPWMGVLCFLPVLTTTDWHNSKHITATPYGYSKVSPFLAPWSTKLRHA